MNLHATSHTHHATETAQQATSSCTEPVQQGDREATGYCRPHGHVWAVQPGRSYQTCFWCDVIRT